MPDEDGPVGSVEQATRDDIEALITEHPMGESLAEVAFNLARYLDGGAGLATAAVARELRATLVELARLGVPDDDGFDDRISNPSLPAEVRDPKEP